MMSWSLAAYVSEWTIRLIMLMVIVTRRHQPNSAVAWLLVIFFLPWLGLALYLLLGANRLPQGRLRQHRRLLAQFQETVRRFEIHPSIIEPPVAAEAAGAVALAQRLGYMPILGGNDVHLMTETAKVIDALVADIDAAEHHVHMLFYIFASDEMGRRVLDALTRAVARGVQCRLLLDAVGSRTLLARDARRLAAQGIQVSAALPVGFFRRSMARIDLRNHRKLVVIDGRIAYTGSQNIIDVDYGRRGLAWHDLMARVVGPAVLELQTVFIADWCFETDETLNSADIFPDSPPAGDVAVQVLPSGPSYPTENYQRMVVAALHAARRRVMITSPYFIPDEPFMQAVQVAVLRGVKVDIVLPRICDKILVGAASRAYYEQLLEVGTKLHLFTPGLLHAKTMTIDDSFAFLGTSNFDIRSFSLNFEINLVLYGKEVTNQLRCRQLQYLAHSTLLSAEQWRSRSPLKKMGDNVAKLLSPLL